MCFYAAEGAGSGEYGRDDVHEPDAPEKASPVEAEAENRSREEDSVRSKRDFDGAKPYDGGRSAPLYTKMQYGQRNLSHRDSRNGTGYDKIIGNPMCALYSGGIFDIVSKDMQCPEGFPEAEASGNASR